MLGVLT